MSSDDIEQAYCDGAEKIFLNNAILNHVHLLLLSITLTAIFILIYRYWRHPITVHGNLLPKLDNIYHSMRLDEFYKLILFANIIAFSFINYLAFFIKYARDSFLFFTYKNSCQLLTPLWFISLTIGPSYLYSIGYPLLHFCIVVERVRATLMAHKYEESGQKLGIWMAICIWFVALVYMAFVVIAAYMDPDMTGHPLATVSINSRYNGQTALYLNIGLTFLVIFTAICAWRITIISRRFRRIRQMYQNYSLSRNFQLNENALAMRLILPLDIFYAFLYIIYQGIVIWIRSSKPYISQNNYILFYTAVNTLLFIYSAITIIVYIQFLGYASRCQKRSVVENRPAPEYGQIYFRQLESQWG